MPVQPGSVLVHFQTVLRLFVAKADPFAALARRTNYLDYFGILDEAIIVEDVSNFQVIVVP